MVVVLLVALALHVGFFAGYYLRKVQTQLDDMREIVRLKKDKPIETVTSSLVDPLDLEYQAKHDFMKKQKELNPELYD